MAPKAPAVVGNASALMMATIATSALGLVFWLIASRLYTPAALGIGSAQISAATLLSTFAQLGLGSLLVRYLPMAGIYSSWIVRRTYAVVLAMSVLLAVGMIALGLTDDYLDGWWARGLFVIAVCLLTLFAIQDSALFAFGAVKVIPIENALFALAKLLLLPLFVGITFVSGVFAAWVVPAGVAVIGVSIYIKRTQVNKKMISEESIPLPPRRTLYPYVWKQFVGTAIGGTVFMIIPLIIVSQIGAEANGYLTLPWMIGIAFYALSNNIVQSFSREVRDGHPITVKMVKHLGMLLFVIIGLGGVACAVLAPIVLDIASPGHPPESTEILRLIGITAPLQAIWMVMDTFWWLEGKFGLFAWLQVAYGTIAVGATWILAPRIGVIAAGVSIFAVGLIYAIGSAIPLARRFRIIWAGGGERWVPKTADGDGEGVMV